MLRFAATSGRDHPRQLPVEYRQCLTPGRDLCTQMRQAASGIARLAVQRLAQLHQFTQADAGRSSPRSA